MPAYLDPNSWLITRRRDFRPLPADIDPTPTTIEQCRSDFQAVAGVKFAFAARETDLKSSEVLETAVIKSIKINPPRASSIFKKLSGVFNKESLNICVICGCCCVRIGY